MMGKKWVYPILSYFLIPSMHCAAFTCTMSVSSMKKKDIPLISLVV